MKKVYLPSLGFLLISLSLIAQPDNPNYVRGTHVCWKFNGFDHGYFRAAGNGERHILISFTGIGENTCGELNRQSPQKLLADAGINWDGRTVRAPGDTIVWEVFTLLHNPNLQSPDDTGFNSVLYARDIEYFFQRIEAIDTSKHCYFHIQGLSAGARNLWRYLINSQGHNSPYRHIFSTTITMSTPEIQSAMKTIIPNISRGRRHWVWVATSDGVTPPEHSDTLYKYLNGVKYLTKQGGGGGHTNVIWDSALSLKGTDTTTNRWLWMVKNECANTGPGPVTGGPEGYVPGTQVCWRFNNRPHGYFRAAGNGERHVLLSFTTQNEDSCDNYNVNAPQKWLPNTWNGKTVRAPGDTIIWEILTIVNTNNNFLAAYADDINYFFNHIAPIDTSNHNRFHAEGKGSGGINRMWGYLVNAQTHNSPYRNIFGTTISQSTPYLGSSGLLPQIATYSPGRRHWVWYGTADAGSPPAASQQLYDALQGTKTLTAQAGGTAGAGTWDSCLSRMGTTVASNRWLWMVSNSSARTGTITSTEQITPDIDKIRMGIYPNPAQNRVMVTVPGLTNSYTLVVTDLTGRRHQVINNVQQVNYLLDVSGLRRGVYFIQIESRNGSFRYKLLKE
jgi:hypothetical protein